MDDKFTPKQMASNLNDLPEVEGSSDFFTGKAYIKSIFPETPLAPFSVSSVRFEAGSRTAWHTHPAGQRIIVTRGKALVCEEGGKVHEFAEGCAVLCPEGIKHWHGAAPDCEMTHTVITGSKDGVFVNWLDKVTDEEYNAR